MREIKFRVWNEKTNKFNKYDFEFVLSLNGKVLNCDHGDIGGEEENIILMQYTGLKDKNGKEIYEGDIVKTISKEDYDTKVLEIKWIEEANCGCCYSVSGFNILNIIDEEGEVEIIGNIYENPELFK